MFYLLFVCEQKRTFKLVVQLFNLLVDAKKNLLLPHYFDGLHTVCFFLRVCELGDAGARELFWLALALALAFLWVNKVSTAILFTCGFLARLKWWIALDLLAEKIVESLRWRFLRVVAWVVGCRIARVIFDLRSPNLLWRSFFWHFLHLLVGVFLFFCRSLLLKFKFFLLLNPFLVIAGLKTFTVAAHAMFALFEIDVFLSEKLRSIRFVILFKIGWAGS